MKLGRRIREIQTGVCFEYRGREDYFAFRFAEDSFFTRLSGNPKRESGQPRQVAAALSSSGLIESCETVPIQRGARIFRR